MRVTIEYEQDDMTGNGKDVADALQLASIVASTYPSCEMKVTWRTNHYD